MLRFMIALSLLVYLVTSATIESRQNNFFYGRGETDESEAKEPVAIVKNVSEKKPDGSFVFAYEAADGSFREEVGKVINPGTDEQELEITGSYRYYDADGQLVEVTYTAGKNGFLPVGSNILPAISDAAKAASEAAKNEENI